MIRDFEKRWLVVAVAVALAIAAILVYRPVRQYAFLNWDDLTYIQNNDHVRGGVTWNGIVWSFTESYSANWCPVTWISYMLGCQIYGLSPAGHHLTNVLFHCANTVLLFLALRRLTSAVWRSAFVAALFGLHPLHVESVAWIAERKDVLSTFFFLLTLLAYKRYVESAGRQVSKEANSKIQDSASPLRDSKFRPALYFGVALFVFACGLMSKPMLVTVPFLLLLLDFWPLGRLRFLGPSKLEIEESTVIQADAKTPEAPPSFKKSGRGLPHSMTLREARRRNIFSLLVEKVPFFVLSAAACVVTIVTQKQAGAVASFEAIPVGARLENAAVSYLQYLAKFLWPTNLSPLYPHPTDLPLWQVAGSVTVLLLLTAVTWRGRNRFGWLFTGWFWFLGTLIPVIGIVQVGSQAFADRYTYIPLIGIMIAVTWGLAEVVLSPARPQMDAGGREDETPKPQFQVPGKHQAINSKGRMQSSVADCGLKFPRCLMVGLCSFCILAFLTWRTTTQLQYWRDTETVFSRVLSLAPNSVQALYALGSHFIDAGKIEDGKKLVERALTLQPNYAEALGTMGNTLDGEGKYEEAVRYYEDALKAAPDNPGVLNNLAWLRAACPNSAFRDGREAVRRAERACELTRYSRPLFIGTLAAARAEAGDFPAAIASGEQAASLATSLRLDDIAARNRELLELYRQGKTAGQK